MLLRKLGALEDNRTPLELVDVPKPVPAEQEILVRVLACGVCHTELDEIEGRTPPARLPVILGHQVVGRVEAVGSKVSGFTIGARVGIGWIFSACGKCEFCQNGQENLCPDFEATGRDSNGGYAEYMTVGEDFAHPIPEVFSDIEAAPLLCAGAIGYRSLRLAGMKNGLGLGLTGFGASGHQVLLMVKQRYPDSRVFVFARSEQEQAFARELGAVWAGDTDEPAPAMLDCIIDTTPVWRPVVKALENLKPGGRLVINAIRKEATDQDSLLQLDYPKHLWMEKEIKSAANVTRQDISEFLLLAAQIGLKPEVQTYSLAQANQALAELKDRRIRGAKVLVL
jgi:propanol-preferring alcohol dehydrogenase